MHTHVGVSWNDKLSASGVQCWRKGVTGHSRDSLRTTPSTPLILTVASPPETAAPETSTSTRTWSEATILLITPGFTVLRPNPTISTVIGDVSDAELKELVGARLARVTSTACARSSPRSSHLDVNLVLRIDKTGSSERGTEGVKDTANRWNLLLDACEGNRILCSAATDETAVDHW